MHYRFLGIVFAPLLTVFVLACGNEAASPSPPPIEGGADRATPAPPALGATPDEDLILPDIRVETPGQLSIEGSGEDREIRFSTTVQNVGGGALEIIGDIDESTGRAMATQIIEKRDGAQAGSFVGELFLHPTHNHWHLEDFAVFEIWRYQPGGRLDSLILSTDKISFCLLDSFVADPAPPITAPEPRFIECNWRHQGLSEGWSETYDASLPGQSLEIGALPDGRYAIRTVVDPSGRLRETNDANNAAVAYVEVREDSVEILVSP
jgi:hypothetical protein